MFLTICTPAYNRSYTLHRTYNSLLNQSEQNFEWVIIDDGSTDDTKELVNKWIQEKKMKIKYYYQENSGKHIALNKGVELSEGKLFTCLDSDDWFYEDAVETMKQKWESIEDKTDIAGLIGLDTYEDGQVVGTDFPINLDYCNWIDLMYEYKVKGDKAYVFVLDVIKNYDFPSFEGNKHMPPSYQLFLLSQKYNMYLINKPLKYVEYLEDGISHNIMKKYIEAPDNYAQYRLIVIDLVPSMYKKITNAIHYNSSRIMSTVQFNVEGRFKRVLIKLTRPLGYLLYWYIKKKNEVKKNK